MCGISGIIDLKNKLDSFQRQKLALDLNNGIIHRGPDENGEYHSNIASLGMRRLSIIDLKSGQQPIFNQRKNALVFFNGEIYNYRELQNDLLKKGYEFKTNSDTEVLIHLYDEYGKEMISLLKGMFAFCIHDLKQNTFFFGRDRFGEKPFFYYFKNDVFIFCSEITPILKCPIVEKKLNQSMLHYYLMLGFVPEPETMVKEILSIPPGHYAELSINGLNVTKWFKINSKKDDSIKTIDDAILFIEPYFEKAVERQMNSEVPLGAFLSGGIDSSSVVAVMQQKTSQPIKTFTVKFEESSYDESWIAKKVSDHLKTEHHEIVIPNATFDEVIFHKILQNTGIPFSDSSAIPSYFISKEIKKHVTVALSGDGGDELFGGYSLFQWWLKIEQLSKLPNVSLLMMEKLLSTLKNFPIANSSSLIRQASNAVSLSKFNSKQRAHKIHNLFRNGFGNLLSTDGNYSFEKMEEYPIDSNDWSSLQKIMYYRIKHNLPLDMLVKVDRMSMANSLEVRAPFLDGDLFEASSKIPDKFLIHQGSGKYIIREMMKNKLPEIVFNHPKTGFSIPLHKYMNNNFIDLCNKYFTSQNPLSEIVNLNEINKIKNKGLSQSKGNADESVYQTAHQLWSLLQLFGWMEEFKIEL